MVSSGDLLDDESQPREFREAWNTILSAWGGTGEEVSAYLKSAFRAVTESALVYRGYEQSMEAIYGIFLQRVARGRQLSLEEVEEVAQGRIWSGREALAAGLVDALGGPMEALSELRRRAGLDPMERFEFELHPRRPRLPELRRLLT